MNARPASRIFPPLWREISNKKRPAVAAASGEPGD